MVNNRGSRTHVHIIGSIPSRKMNRSIGYESLWGECLFYYFLEIDPLTIRYYEQPVEVFYQKLNAQYILEQKKHVPDTLVFRQGFRPHLFQVKGGNTFIEQEQHLYKASLNYAQENGWSYTVAHPKLLPPIIQSNLMLLMHYMRPRDYYKDWIPEIINKMKYLEDPTIEQLAKSFTAKADHRDILPIVYHLIFRGDLHVSINSPINHNTALELGDFSQELFSYFNLEGDQLVTPLQPKN
jgi:hypothetical protein